MTLTDSVAVLPPEARKRELPYMVVWLMLGAKVHENYKGKDGYALELDGEFWEVSPDDYGMAVEIKGEVSHGCFDRMPSGKQLLDVHKYAAQAVEHRTPPSSAKKIAMLKDQGGAGYWRMVLPARYLEQSCTDDECNNVHIDVTAAGVKFDYLMEYDTIFVQRLHDWESFYVLEKLKKAGKRIVYDIDDDIFSLTPDNPAFHVISRDNQQAALACMKLADCVTTTTAVLQNRLAQVMDNGVWPEVIPNALDTDDRWLPTEKAGSPDGNKRIFWQGSATHEEDLAVCVGAIDRVMKAHPNVRLVLLGYLPQCVLAHVNEPAWQGRVEHVGFSDTETYFEMIHHVRAEVGIAPLAPKTFNEAKSPIKWLEYTCIGIPTVASAMEPYSSVIEHGESGLLAETEEDWVNYINDLLIHGETRQKMLTRARGDAGDGYDIKKMVEAWREVLLV